MKIPLQITFSNMDPSDAVRARIEELAAKLDRFSEQVVSCRVVISAPNKRQRSGKLYHVSIDLALPGHEIAINKASPKDQAHEDIYVAIRDAFDALTRRVEDATRKMRHDVKSHEAPASARVVRLFPEQDYGFLEDATVGEVYFHANSVLNGGFKKLTVGARVTYVAAPGEKGLQASVVKPLA